MAERKTELWDIETGNRCILRYDDGGTVTYSVASAYCYYAKTVDGVETVSPEDGSLEYSFDKATWYAYAHPGPASDTIWQNGGTVYFRVRVDGKTVLSLSTVVREYSDGASVPVPEYSGGSTEISVGSSVAMKYDHINLSLLRTVDGETGTADARSVSIQKVAKGTQYSMTVTPGSVVRTSSKRWQNFSGITVNVSKRTGDDPWTLAGDNEVGVYYRINDGLPSDRVALVNGVATVSAAAFSPATTERIDVFITAGEAADPVIDMETIAVLELPSAGASGHVGRFYYYGGVWDADKEYLMDTTQAPYVKRHCTIDGVEKDYFFMLDFGGTEVSNPTSLDDDPGGGYGNGNPWTLMSSTFQYYIAEAFFGSYAHFGAFIINGDWMISQYGRIYYSNGQGTNIDSATKAAQFKNETGTDAYTNFYPQYPNSNYPGVMNFCPSFAVDGLTGRVYLNKAFFKGGMSVPMVVVDDTNLSEYTSDVSGNKYVEFIPDDVGGFNFQCSSALTLALPYPDETMDGREFEIFNSTDNASATINVLGTNVVGGGNNTIGKNGYMKYKVVKADIYDNWEWLRIAKMGDVA